MNDGGFFPRFPFGYFSAIKIADTSLQLLYHRHQALSTFLLSFNTGLPDGLFSNQKSKFG
jgi:hypothetical protein